MTQIQLPEIKDDFSQLLWVSRGVSGNEPPVTKRLIELDADHLGAIIKNCPHIQHLNGGKYHRAIRTLLEMP